MSNIEMNLKKLIEWIQLEKLEGIIKHIETTILEKPDEKSNRHIFKLLLYLSHTAAKCNGQRLATGREIYKVTRFLCSVLTEIPDKEKYVSCLFHIIRSLLGMSMYKEAADLNHFLKSDEPCNYNEKASKILEQIAYLWYTETKNMFLNLQKNPSSSKHYLILKDTIKYELETTKVIHKDYTMHLLIRISSYPDKIALISEPRNAYFVDFYEFILSQLKQAKLSLNNIYSTKCITYCNMLLTINKIISNSINENHSKFVMEIVAKVSHYFEMILRNDRECLECFQLFESMCLTILKSFERPVDDNVKMIQDNVENYAKIVRQHGHTEITKRTTLNIVQILESLFTQWETCMKPGTNVFLENGALLEIMHLIERISNFCMPVMSNRCKFCEDIACAYRRDIYNAMAIKARCVNLVSKLSVNHLSKDVCVSACKFLEENIITVYELKQCNCKCWTQLWSTNGALIYNMGIMSDRFYEESTLLFSLLCTSIIQFEGVQSVSQYIGLKSPICSTLHRLTNVHYNHSMYREAMTVCALNGLLSYNDAESKAFRMWANIKWKCAGSRKIMPRSMLACLRADKGKIGELGLSIELSKYDLVQLCLRETRGLQNVKVNLSSDIQSVLDEMIVLKATPVQYASAVQMLVFHLLNFDYVTDVSEYLGKAISNLRHTETNSSRLCLEANLEFCVFVNRLHIVNKQTQMEMESTKFALYPQRLAEIKETDAHDVIPAYTMININEDSRLMMYLQKAVNKWTESFKLNFEAIGTECDPDTTLRILLIAGEYARLYRFEACEANIWKLAYRLALELKEEHTILYVTGRSISLRQIDQEWITIAKGLATRLVDSNDGDMIYAIGIFWISLSDLYFERGMRDEARKLLDKVNKLQGISFCSNTAVYLYSLDRILSNYRLYRDNMGHIEYTKCIVKILYTMVNLNEELNLKTGRPQDKHLFGYDMLFSTTVNLSLRMNSLLSFREIGSHLMRRLNAAQALGVTIRVAEILKSLCYIDLSRSKLNDCEVKVQGLEHILNIETFQLSMNTDLSKIAPGNHMTTPTRIIDPIRDVPQNDTSPVLRNKVFALPKFLSHANCNCYACKNVSYHYLVFASTHIRAQLYALQNNDTAALQHFHGAFEIQEKLMSDKLKLYNCSKKSKEKNQKSPWQERYYIIDYVLMLLDFSYFMKSNMHIKDETGESIILYAIHICKMYNLQEHPIYVSIKELLFAYCFRRVLDPVDCSTFTVTNPVDLDVDIYQENGQLDQAVCCTPTANIAHTKKPLTIRRNRTPPLLKLTKLSMNFSDDEESNASPPSFEHKRTRSRSRLTRRKLLDDQFSDISSDVSTSVLENVGSNSKSRVNEVVGRNSEKSTQDNAVQEIVNKIVALAPNVSEYLYELADNSNVLATHENMQKLIDMVENLQITASAQSTVEKKTRGSKKLSTNDYNRKINDIVDLFKGGIVKKSEDSTGFVSKHDLALERTVEFVSSVPTDDSVKNKLKETRPSETKTVRSTRNSTKRTVPSKETYGVKTRKSKEKSL